MKKFFFKIIVILFIVAIWHITAVVIANPIIFPSVADIFESLRKIFVNGDLISEASHTAVRVIFGLAVTLIFGVIIGIICGLVKLADELIMPVVTFLQSTPVISWILLALIWVDNKIVPVFVVVISTMPVIILNIKEGIIRTDSKLLEMADLYNVGSLKKIRDIYLPSLKGYIVSAVKITIGLIFKVAVMAEVFAHPGRGIGEKMNTARLNLETADIAAWTIIIVLFTFILEKGVEKIFKAGTAK